MAQMGLPDEEPDNRTELGNTPKSVLDALQVDESEIRSLVCAWTDADGRVFVSVSEQPVNDLSLLSHAIQRQVMAELTG